MQFVRRDVWHVAFLEPGLQTPLPKKLTFKDEGKDQGVGTPRRGLADLRGPATAGLRNSEGRGRCLFEVVAWTVRTTETALTSQSPLVGREWHRSRETCGATRYRGLEKIREFARRGEAWAIQRAGRCWSMRLTWASEPHQERDEKGCVVGFALRRNQAHEITRSGSNQPRNARDVPSLIHGPYFEC
jgi:hypothetical protein